MTIKRCVLQIAYGAQANRELDITRDNHRALASRLNSDYREVRSDKELPFGLCAKFKAVEVAKEYDQTLYLDCDTIVQEQVANPFDLVPVGHWGVVDEMMLHAGGMNEFQNIFEKITWAAGKPHIPFSLNINSGVMILPRDASAYLPPTFPLPNHWCVEQLWLSFQLVSQSIPFVRLPARWNWCFHHKGFYEGIDSAAIVHLNERTDREARLNEITNRWKVHQPCDLSELVAVTSLSPSPNRIDRQRECMRTWRSHGLKVIAVQSESERKQLEHRFPEVDEWFCPAWNQSIYDKPVQAIKNLTDQATRLDQPILMINSDIEIAGSTDVLKALVRSGKPMVGIRFNYDSTHADATREKYGLDAFLLSPEHVKNLPTLPLSIGKPFWDYWIPLHLSREGFEPHWEGRPMFFHKSHDLLWTDDDFQMGMNLLRNHYGAPIDWSAWRESQPFPPSTET